MVQVMVPQPTCLPAIVPVRDVLAVLSNTTHHGFPVISNTSAGPSDGVDGAVGQLEGLVLRSQLLVLLRKRRVASTLPINATCVRLRLHRCPAGAAAVGLRAER